MTPQFRTAGRVWLALIACLTPGLSAWADDPQAQLLIARPGMLDPGFAESVVLVTFPPDTGPMGVILNKPTTSTIRDAFPENPELSGRTDVVYWGGVGRSSPMGCWRYFACDRLLSALFRRSATSI